MELSLIQRTKMGLAVVLPLATLVGCDLSGWTQSAQDAAQQAQKNVTETVETVQTEVQEQTGQAGGAEFKLAAEASADSTSSPNPTAAAQTNEKSTACYVLFTLQQDGRSNVLALQSYKNAERETFPSFYIHAFVEAATLAELAGQTVPAQMYLKSRESGATLFTPSDAPLQLKIVAVEDTRVTAEIVGGSLTSATDGSITDISGQFTAVVP